MGGWKGKVGGVGAMLAAIGGILAGFSSGTLDTKSLMELLGMISLGLSTFGIRSAIGPGIQGGVPIVTPPNPNKQTGPAIAG